MESRMVGEQMRRVCTACSFVHFTDPKVGVGVVVMAEDKLLLVKRMMAPEIGKWSIPAGYLDAGEDPRETAVREVWEETNLSVEIGDLVDVYFNEDVATEGGASIFILYEATLLGGELKAGDDAAAARFFGPDELPELAFTSTLEIVKSIQSQRGPE